MWMSQKVSRRKLLTYAGAGAVVVAAGAAGVYYLTRPTTVKLDAWQWGAEWEAVNKSLETIVNTWNSAHPEAIVTYTIFPDVSETEFAAKVKQAAGGAKAPVLMYMVDTTILTELASDNYLDEPPSDLLNTLKTAIDPKFHYMLDMYAPDGTVKAFGAGVTVGMNACVLFYNKKTFQEVGLDPQKPPQTWDDLRDAAKALVKKDSTGKIIRSGYSVRKGGNPGGVGEKFIGYAIGNGAKILWKEGGKWYTDINQQPVIEAAQFLHDLIYVDKVDVTDTSSWGYDPWLNGTTAISGPLGVGFITNTKYAKPEMLADLGVTNIPSPGGIQNAASFGDLYVLCVCSKATQEQKDKAWEFLRFFNQPDNIKKVSNDIWNWTPYKDSINNPPFSTEDSWKRFNEVLSSVGRPHIVNEYGPGWNSMTAMLGNNLVRAFTNEVTVKEALNKTYQDFQDYMKTNKFYTG
jgi:sn-glycerol 3-phosphate transport system substrate-binding protein